MPNWCSTVIYFDGEEKVLDDFENKIKLFTSKEFVKSDFGKNWLGNILQGFGFAYEYYRCRGTLEGSTRLSSNTLQLYTETAWTPMMEMWDIIISKHYTENGVPQISYHILAEESNLEFYVTNDKFKQYFPEKYVLELENNGEYSGLEILESDEQLIESINETYKQNFKTIDEVNKFEKDFDQNDNNYLSIHEYIYDDYYDQKIINIQPGIIYD